MPAKQHNIIAIMADDIGIWDIGAYSRVTSEAQIPRKKVL